MAEDVDKSLLERLHALRGGAGGTQSSQAAPQIINIDVIERAKTPSREDALTARLRCLRESSATPEPEGQRASPKPAPRAVYLPSEKQDPTAASSAPLQEGDGEEEDIEHVFETDDDTLQELLADVTPDEDLGIRGAHEPSDEQVKALLEKLADEIPKDTESPSRHKESDNHEPDSDDDDSDSEAMKRKVNDVVEQYQDEAELEAPPDRESLEDGDFQDPHDEATHDDNPDAADLGLPSVPSDLQDLPSSPGAKQGRPGLDDMAARMAALRAPSHSTDGGGDDEGEGGAGGSFGMPDVPTSRPSTRPVQRLQTRTRYTDDDVDGWCTVCLEDATLRCLGCDDDVYCARCWREMHVGPAAAFDDRSHRAVQFTRDRKKKEAPRKVALGA